MVEKEILSFYGDKNKAILNLYNKHHDTKVVAHLIEMSENEVRYILRLNNIKIENKRNEQDGDSYYKYNNQHIHRTIAEAHVGRKLLKDEIVHHIDFDPRNNDISNLLITSRKKHKSIESQAHIVLCELLKKGIIKFEKEKGYWIVDL